MYRLTRLTTALRVFGLKMDDSPEMLELFRRGETALDQLRISEDSVIEHDARFVTGFKLNESDLKGRAIFVKNNERLEVITANRRPLEELFGVDLIYVNALMGNIVMVQYKMLEREGSKNNIDWIYRPDTQFQKETDRMRQWVVDTHSTSPYEYRLNSEVFYLKFVKRHAELGRASYCHSGVSFRKSRERSFVERSTWWISHSASTTSMEGTCDNRRFLSLFVTGTSGQDHKLHLHTPV